jgi:hypothetical protein
MGLFKKISRLNELRLIMNHGIIQKFYEPISHQD